MNTTRTKLIRIGEKEYGRLSQMRLRLVFSGQKASYGEVIRLLIERGGF